MSSWNNYGEFLAQHENVIQLTISPDPSRRVRGCKKILYGALDPDEQRELIIQVVDELMEELYHKVHVAHLHFEKSGNDNIHCHGFIVRYNQFSYDYLRVKITKFINLRLGRLGLSKNNPCTVVQRGIKTSNEDVYPNWFVYICKEDFLPPFHHNFQTIRRSNNILNYLPRGGPNGP